MRKVARRFLRRRDERGLVYFYDLNALVHHHLLVECLICPHLFYNAERKGVRAAVKGRLRFWESDW